MSKGSIRGNIIFFIFFFLTLIIIIIIIISALEAAQHELSEEAHLKQGEWINLLPPSQPADGISELKWGKNRFVPYICINPIQDDTPMNRDYEEHIEIIRDVPIDQLRKFITRGEMMLPSVQTCWMAIEYLKENNLL